MSHTCPTKHIQLYSIIVVLTSLGGFEPSTYGLEGRCSIQLSYRLIRLSSLELTLLLILLLKALRKRVMGIEPTYLAWKASVLPLNYTRMNHLSG